MKRSGCGSNLFEEIVERRTPSVSEGLLQPSMNLPSGENILLHTFSYVFADKSNQHHLTQYEGMHHNPFESFLSSGIALHFADPHISLSVGILS